MAKAAAKQDETKAPLTFTLERLQEAARRVGAPPLADTEATKGAVKLISAISRKRVLKENGKFERDMGAKDRLAFNNFQNLLSRSILGNEAALEAALSEPEIFGTSLIRRSQRSIEELKRLHDALVAAKKHLVFSSERKRGQHQGYQLNKKTIW